MMTKSWSTRAWPWKTQWLGVRVPLQDCQHNDQEVSERARPPRTWCPRAKQGCRHDKKLWRTMWPQAHVINSFHQLSLCSRRIWEFFFICSFTMVCFFNDNYKIMTTLILFMLVFKMFVVGVFCNCHNIWSSWRCITQVRNMICSLRMHDCISGQLCQHCNQWWRIWVLTVAQCFTNDVSFLLKLF